MRKSRRFLLRSLLFGLPCALLLGMPSLAQDPEFAFDQVVGHPAAFLSFPPKEPGAK